jgi:quercetin dioxygenase-like cupin family protein
MTPQSSGRREHIADGRSAPEQSGGVARRTFVSAAVGSRGLSTGTDTLAPFARTPFHQHPCSEAITVLEGEAVASIDGCIHRLGKLDCIHVPAFAPHEIANPSGVQEAVLHWALAFPHPEHQASAGTSAEGRVHIARFTSLEAYELSRGALFRDLFAARFGSQGICGGYGEFQPGASLPCHTHVYDESITIVSGRATCMVQGRRYQLSGCDTALVPQGLPHRFLNESTEAMAMVWVYAGSEPERELVDARYCSGELVWLA